MVKVSASGAKIRDLNPACDDIFPGRVIPVTDTPVATLPGAWCYRVSAGTGRPGISTNQQTNKAHRRLPPQHSLSGQPVVSVILYFAATSTLLEVQILTTTMSGETLAVPPVWCFSPILSAIKEHSLSVPSPHNGNNLQKHNQNNQQTASWTYWNKIC